MIGSFSVITSSGGGVPHLSPFLRDMGIGDTWGTRQNFPFQRSSDEMFGDALHSKVVCDSF